MRTLLLLAVVATTLSAPRGAVADPMPFLRIDQSGGLSRGDFAAGWSVESARGLLHVEGSGTLGAYSGATHRLNASFGLLDWLSAGVEQSIRQIPGQDLKVGVLSPELRARLDAFGLASKRGGLGVYAQSRLRLNARRPTTWVTGVLYDRDLGRLNYAARAGFEQTIGAALPETGYRAEAGISYRVLPGWRANLEFWSSGNWRSGYREADHHAGPSLQYEWDALRIGAQMAFGFKDRTDLVVLDMVGMLRLGFGF